MHRDVNWAKHITSKEFRVAALVNHFLDFIEQNPSYEHGFVDYYLRLEDKETSDMTSSEIAEEVIFTLLKLGYTVEYTSRCNQCQFHSGEYGCIRILWSHPPAFKKKYGEGAQYLKISESRDSDRYYAVRDAAKFAKEHRGKLLTESK